MKYLLQLRRFLRPYAAQATLAVVLTTAGVGVDLILPKLIQKIVDQGIMVADLPVVLGTSGTMLLVSVAGLLLSVFRMILMVKVMELVGRDIRGSVFGKIQQLSFSNLDRLRTGNLIVRTTNDVTVLQRAVDIFTFFMVRAGCLLVGSLGFMFATNAVLALRLLPFLVLILVMISLFGRRLADVFMQVRERLDNVNNVLQENLAGVRVVKSFVRNGFEKERFGAANGLYADSHIRALYLIAVLGPTVQLVMNMAAVAIIWFGGITVIEGTMSVGQIFAFNNYLLSTMRPIMMVSMMIGSLSAADASAQRVSEVLNTRPEITDAQAGDTLTGGDAVRNVAVKSAITGHTSSSVEFLDVSFSYASAADRQGEKILEEITFKADPGQTIGILGGTGAGKSSLVQLIPRFYDVTGGRILVDGRDIRELRLKELRSRISMVLQDVVLFSGTVRDNIAYGRPDAPMDDVVLAAETAQAHEFIEQLPEKYDTQVKQRGVNLSGGQKQRLAIARAICVRPSILILDDSTSAVDIDTEVRIHDAMEEIIADTTVFIIAQRISSVLNAHRILVLDGGRLSASGTHEELLEISPVYREIYESQLGGVKV